MVGHCSTALFTRGGRVRVYNSSRKNIQTSPIKKNLEISKISYQIQTNSI
jgi:hypothetical protein